MAITKVIPLGGVGEIGKNCTLIEQGDDIIVLDVGLSFPDEDMPGVDIVIPDFTYLLENRERVRGIFLTHAHEDHVGGLPYLLRDLNVPVYAGDFTHALIRSKLEEKTDAKKLILRPLKAGEVVKVGSLSVEPVRVTHSIPETFALAVGTDHGTILLTSDFKFDFTPVDGKLTQMSRLGELGDEGVVLLLSDSTNVERPGWGPSESEVAKGLRNVMSSAPGRVLLTTFASNIHRMQQVYEMAAETGRVVAVVGRRMEQNVDICTRLGYLKIPKGVRINLDEMPLHDPAKTTILITGSQGEPMSALVQMSRGEYGRLKLQPGDTLIYSARPIPGNEAAIWRTINRLFRMGVNVMYDAVAKQPIHVSGHAYREELKMMINLTRPFYLAPVHGEPRHQHIYLEMAREMSYPEHRLFTLKDGEQLCLDDTKAWIDPPVVCGRVLVDSGGGVGVTDEALRDRHNLSRDGAVTISVAIDVDQGEAIGEAIVQARGVHAEDRVFKSLGDGVDDLLNGLSRAELQDADYVRHQISDFAKRFLMKRTNTRPIVLPTVIQI